ncbi:MAG: oxidoreductase [Aeromicrobium sp.]|nr:MAG: oxidoreductase [Aeromicrobium sp.]
MSDPFIAAALLEGVPSSYRSTRDSIDAVLRDRGLRKSTPEHTARSLLLGAWASATLEGSSFDVDELAEGGGDETAKAAVRLSTQLLGLLPMWRTSPVQAMARIHALAAAGSVADEDLGRPVNPDGVKRLQALGDMMKEKSEAPALVVAALAHAEIIAAGAFISHNAVVARAVERLLFVDRGIDPASVTVPEVGHVMDAQGYFAALKAYESQATGVHQWLLWCADSYARAAEASPLNGK